MTAFPLCTLLMPPTTRLSAPDLAVVVLYLVGITLFGLRFSRRGSKKSPQANSQASQPAASQLTRYFLAGNTIPWWAIALSIVSAETSTLTIISIPGVAFAGNLGFLQVVLGYMLGRLVVAALFLPRYFEGRMLTAYQLIQTRFSVPGQPFGQTLYKLTAGLFLLTRAAAEGVRVFAISIVVGIAIGTNDILSIGLISALTLLYTFEGGMAAVIWTDVVQMALYLAGTIVAMLTLGHQVPGGWGHIYAVAAPLGKFHWLDFSFSITKSYTFWAGILGGTFLTMASHGTDQLMVQRMLAARNLSAARAALLSSGVVIFVQFTLFLLIGVGLFVFYGAGDTLAPSAIAASGTISPDRIFPTFIVQQMPHGVSGLLVAAILAAAMSNLSAALNSLASTTVIDFYLPWRTSRALQQPVILSDARSAQQNAPDSAGPASTARTFPPTSAHAFSTETVSRLATVFWAVVLFAIAVYSVHAGGKGHVVETGLSIASVAYGCLLGVFLLGTLTPRLSRYGATQWGAVVGMVAGLATNLFLWLTHLTPKVAFTWYVLIGALVTFLIGTLASLILKSRRATTIVLLTLATAACPKVTRAQQNAIVGGFPTTSPSTSYNFTAVSTLIETAIAQKKLPGAVVVIGHKGKIVFEQAYGVRKLAGEPGLNGKPSPAEPMTTDTIFDMASLTKVLVTAPAILQLYEQGKLDLDAPVARYLPEFAQNGKATITVRELLTHYSGLPEDISLKDPWGLAKPDKAEGIRRAMASVPYGPPGVTFKYSDINFITLGYLVEKLSGQRLDDYASANVFRPLSLTRSRYLAMDRRCGVVGFAAWSRTGGEAIVDPCIPTAWATEDWVRFTAPTAHDNEGTAETNPDFDHLLRGTVHDPTTRRMGGVAGHAGLFSTADDVARFCDALLAKLLRNTGPFPLKQSTLQMATSPQAPPTAVATATIFTPAGDPTKGVAQRGLGWDLNSAFSRPRGTIFPITTQTKPGSFGHTGFTGTSIWIDPTSDTYVILLANAIHPRGAPPISGLRGEVATAAAKVIDTADLKAELKGDYKSFLTDSRPPILQPTAYDPANPCAPPVICDSFGAPSPHPSLASVAEPSRPWRSASPSSTQPKTLTGIDVLEQTDFALLKSLAKTLGHPIKIGLLTNQSGLDSEGHRTIDILLKASPEIELKTLFTPEHGLLGKQDTDHLTQEPDAATQLPVISLYGTKSADRHPKQSDLKPLDAILIDLQDAGVRTYTYETLTGYFLEACAHAGLPLYVLDRPNPIGGVAVQGPFSDEGLRSYNAFTPIPLRHGLTLGELARYFNAYATEVDLNPTLLDAEAIQMGANDSTHTGHPDHPPATRPGLHANLTVIPMQNWHRNQYFDQTGLTFIPPSPNLRTQAAAELLPALTLVEATNISVGRGSATPFEAIAASFIDPRELVAYLEARKIPGIRLTLAPLTVAEDANHYPGHGETLPGIHFEVTDRAAFDSPEFGLELITALHHLYPKQFNLDRAKSLIANAKLFEALKAGQDPRDLAAGYASADATFRKTTAPYLLYH